MKNTPFRLIKNEFRKTIKPVGLIITSCILIVLFSVFAVFLDSDSESLYEGASEKEILLYEELKETDDWKEQYKIQMQLNETLEDIYGEEYVDMQNSMLQYKIDNEIEPKETGNNTFDFIKYTFSTLGFVIVIISSLFFTKPLEIEYHNKTEKLIYTKPYSRLKIYLSKYLVSSSMTFLLLVFCYLMAYIIGGIVFTFEGYNATSVMFFDNNIIEMSVIADSFINAGILLVNTFVCGTISFAICSVTHNRMVGMGTGLALYFLGNPVTQKLFEAGMEWVKYVPFSYTNWNMFVNNPLNDSFKITYAVISLGLTLVALMVVSGFLLKKKDI